MRARILGVIGLQPMHCPDCQSEQIVKKGKITLQDCQSENELGVDLLFQVPLAANRFDWMLKKISRHC